VDQRVDVSSDVTLDSSIASIYRDGIILNRLLGGSAECFSIEDTQGPKLLGVHRSCAAATGALAGTGTVDCGARPHSKMCFTFEPEQRAKLEATT
jgi:hypothetical protein